MEENTQSFAIAEEVVMAKIYVIRGIRVMLDRDLAELYLVETKQLKRAVRRNIDRFLRISCLSYHGRSLKNLRCQIGTSGWESVRYAPLAFTEQGVALLSSQKEILQKLE